MNQPAHLLFLSRKQMPKREKLNLGRAVCGSEQVKAQGQPEGKQNKNCKMQRDYLWSKVQVLLTSIAFAFEGPDITYFQCRGCKDGVDIDKIWEIVNLALGLKDLIDRADTNTIVGNSLTGIS